MKKKLAAALAAATMSALALSPTAATAATVTPQQVAGDAAVATLRPVTEPVTEQSPSWRKVVAESPHADRVQQLWAHSPSMDRDIPVAVLPAPEAGAPTIYLLDGAGGAAQNMDWITMSSVLDFYADKNVNLVIPMAGAFSYYIDWVQTPNSQYLQGPQKWETFLTKELPGPVEAHVNAGNQRGIAGYSMSATSAMLMAEHNPGFYDAAAGYSGCYSTSAPHTYGFTALTINRGGASVEQAFGPLGSPHNHYNDALINAEGLRGTAVYLSNSSGLAGRSDQQSELHSQFDPNVPYDLAVIAAGVGTAQLQVEGGVIEAATNQCTHDMKAKLDSLGIPVHAEFRDMGTHSWPYWRGDVVTSWETTFAPAFGR